MCFPLWFHHPLGTEKNKDRFNSVEYTSEEIKKFGLTPEIKKKIKIKIQNRDRPSWGGSVD